MNYLSGLFLTVSSSTIFAEILHVFDHLILSLSHARKMSYEGTVSQEGIQGKRIAHMDMNTHLKIPISLQEGEEFVKNVHELLT